MADVVVAFQGWDASGVGWGDDPWGESLAALPTGTGAVGSVTTATLVLVTGVQAVASVGSVTVAGNVSVFLTGVLALGQVGTVVLWGIVDDNQTPNWQNVNDAQAGNWTVVLT